MKEADFQESILDLARSEGYCAQRFSEEYGVGIPDVFLGSPAMGFWLECKYIELPKLPATPLLRIADDSLRGTQYAWLMQAHRRPCWAAAIVGFDRRWVVIPADRILLDTIQGPNSGLHDRFMIGIPSFAAIRISLLRYYDELRIHPK